MSSVVQKAALSARRGAEHLAKE